MRVGQLSRQAFSLLVNSGSRGVTGAAALLPGCTYRRTGAIQWLPVMVRLGGQSELRAAASRKAIWWDLRLASLLTHLTQRVDRSGNLLCQLAVGWVTRASISASQMTIAHSINHNHFTALFL